MQKTKLPNQLRKLAPIHRRRHKNMKQKGFIAQILLIALLIASVSVGSYLVKQKTNLFPKAADKTVACDGQSLSGQSDRTKEDFRGVYGDNAAVEWVKEHERDLKAKGLPCNDGSSGSRSGTDSGGSTKKANGEICVNGNECKSGNCQSQSTGKNKKCEPEDSNTTSGPDNKNVACDGQSLDTQSDRTKKDFRAAFGDNAAVEWVKEHEKALQDDGTPCGSSTIPGSSCKLSNQDPAVSSTCANWLDNKDPDLIDSIKKSSADFSNCTRAQIVSYWCNGSGKTECEARKRVASACGGSGSGGGPTGQQGQGQQSGQQSGTQACNPELTKQTYYDAKVANRYARFVAIMRGIPEYCVQADLGLPPGIRDDSEDGSIKNGRLYLCSGKESSPDKLDLVWRIISDEGHIAASKRNNPGPDKQNVKEVMFGFGYVQAAEAKLGISPSMIQW